MSELIKNLRISNSIFEKDTSTIKIDGFFNALLGVANKLTLSDCLKSGMGEFTERYIELHPSNKLKKVAALNIVDNKINFIDPQKVYLLRDTENYNINSFIDSSGTAYFTNVEDAIKKAFFEFIERQSLVYSFLREWPGKKINKRVVHNQLKPYSKFKFSNLMINDISIIKDIYVILFVGINRNSYNVGLGTDFNLLTAINNALAEGMGNSPFYVSDNEIKKRNKLLNTLDYHLKYTDLQSIESYSMIFSNWLTPRYILKKFNYLNKASVLEGKKRDLDISSSIIEKIKRISMENSVNPNLTFLNGKSKNIRGTVMHFSAKEAYPHIFTPFINPNNYKISYLLHSNNNFPNKYKYLPFP